MLKRRKTGLALAGLIGGGLAVSALGGSNAFAASATGTAPANAVSDGLSEPDGSLWTTTDHQAMLGRLASKVVGWTARPGGGAWEFNAVGGVFARGGAPFHGSLGGRQLPSPVVAMAATPTGAGYWLVTAGGGVYTFGDAVFAGTANKYTSASPLAAIAGTPTGKGYWLVTAAGGVYTFGDAGFHGSLGNRSVPSPVVGIAPTATGKGYILTTKQGGVYAFGDAVFAGSNAGQSPLPTVSVTAHGAGYDLVRVDGLVTQFRSAARPVKVTIPIPSNEVAAGEAAAAQAAAPAAPAISRDAAIRAKVVSVAQAQMGKPYVYGAVGPGAFDCSGLTQYAYGQAGVSIPRTAAQQLAGTPNIPAAQLQPGDLVYFYPGVTHVGIYIGNGQMIDAPHVGSVVRVDQIQYFGPLMGASDPAA